MPRPPRRYGLHTLCAGSYVASASTLFAIWVALTLTFLLPRLMPGDPIGGILQRLSPAQIQSNPGIIQTYQELLGGGDQSIWRDYSHYLHRVATLNFGISTSNYPTQVSEVVGADAPVLDRARRHRVRRSRSSSARRSARSPPGAAARRFDTVLVPIFMALERVPRVLHGPARRLLPRAEARLVPDPARLRQRRQPGRQLAVHLERGPATACSPRS